MQTPTRDDAADVDFRAAYSRTYAALVRYARRRVPASEADDVVAEVFLTAWRRWADRPSTDDPLPWLYGIAANVLRNHGRGDRRRLRLVSRLAGHLGSESVAGPDATLGLGDLALAEAMQQLSFDEQEVLRLTAWEQLSHAEIAVALGCSVNAVAIRSHRAKRRLANVLTGNDARQIGSGAGHEVVSAPAWPDGEGARRD